MFPVWLLEGQIERKCQNRISKGNSELTGAQWVPSRAVLAYVCPKRPNMGQIGPRDIGADLDFGADLALSILQCRSLVLNSLITHAGLTQPEHLILVRWMGLETQ